MTAGSDKQIRRWRRTQERLGGSQELGFGRFRALKCLNSAQTALKSTCSAHGERNFRLATCPGSACFRQEQLFLSEERAKELEDQFEQEVEREDLQVAAAPRASRRTVESAARMPSRLKICEA